MEESFENLDDISSEWAKEDVEENSLSEALDKFLKQE